MKTKILVTGSCGFIFSNFIRYVRKNHSNYEIVSIDAIKDQKLLNTIYANRGHTFYMGDITDNHFVENVMAIERPDIVIHGAAESFVDKSISAPQEFIKSNVLGTQVMIDASLKNNIKRFVYISTDEVMGHLPNDSDPSWTEESPVNPRNTYSATKAAGELLVKAAHETHGLIYNITRSCNNYGPRQPRRNLIPVIIGNILDKKPVPIYGQGMQIRDWLHVQDNCKAILTIIEKGKENEIYNISANQEYRNIEVFHEICNILKEEYNIEGYNLLKFVEDRKGHDFRYSVDSSKLKQLGWSPEFKFKDGIKHTINWYYNNQWYLR